MAISEKEREELEEMFAAIEPHIETLTTWQQGFIPDQIKRFRQYGANLFLSPKQWDKIKEAYADVTGEAKDDGGLAELDFEDARPAKFAPNARARRGDPDE